MSGVNPVRSEEKRYKFPEVDLDKPRYDQGTYVGRAKHFFIITNPLNLLTSSSKLEAAKQIVQKHRSREALTESITEDQLWRAKHLYDSAFHPDTGEKMILIGRMSAQVPMNMLITTGMMTFYKTTPAVLFWQWINQSFNAIVNYTNRSGDTKISEKRLFTSYVCATSGAIGTGLFFNRIVKNFPPLIGRFVPFIAVAAANCINIPFMRSVELAEGIPIFDENDNRIGMSKRAAQWGITQVVLSRICMGIPSMFLTPFVMDYYEKKGTWAKYPNRVFPIQLGLIGLCLVFATPLACAFFKQQAEFKTARLEASTREYLAKTLGDKVPKVVYYNKGL